MIIIWQHIYLNSKQLVTQLVLSTGTTLDYRIEPNFTATYAVKLQFL